MSKGVYWIGQDNNTYIRTEGMAVAERWRAPLASPQQMGLTQIDDPVNSTTNNTTSTPAPAPTGSSYSGGSAGPEFKDTTAQRNAAQESLDSLGTIKNNRYATEDRTFNNLLGDYATERTKEQGRYNDQTVDNETSLSKQNQAAMLAAAQGGRGLRATLAAMGALGGTGTLLADRAITDSANADLGGARDNFDVNAKTLQTAWGDYEDLDKKREREARDVRSENRQAIDADILTTRQKLLQDMASYWEQAGNDGQYGNYMAQATSLTPQIAGQSRPTAQKYNRTAGSFSPGELSNYLAGNRDMTVGREAGGAGATALNNPLYALSQKKEKELV